MEKGKLLRLIGDYEGIFIIFSQPLIGLKKKKKKREAGGKNKDTELKDARREKKRLIIAWDLDESYFLRAFF